MMRSAPTLMALGVVLAACAAEDAGPSFASEAEARCFEQTRAGLAPGFVLTRDRRGRWQEALQRDGFVTAARPSQDMVDCVARAGLGPVPGVDRPLTLSDAELAVWDKLTPAQRQAAFETLQQQGGSLADALAAANIRAPNGAGG